MATPKKISTPLTEETARLLKMGDQVLITGTIYTGRDAAHKKLCEALEKEGKLPIDLKGEIICYIGASPAKPKKIIGSVGPTTSYRMDAYSPAMIYKAGLRGMIGKGQRGEEVIKAMKEKGAVYFAAVGGTAALISKTVKKAAPILYQELGPEAVYKYEVENFPAIVATDSEGNDLYKEGPKKFRKRETI